MIWRITDGRKGHEKQTQALVQGLNTLHCHTIEEYILPCGSVFNSAFELPNPDVIMGAGHGTHLPLLICKLLFGGKTVLLMKPSLPAVFFDVVFVPQHDSCTSLGNVHFTEGVLSPSIDNSPHPSCGVILLGGISRHFDWNTENIVRSVQEITRLSPEKTWTVCDSPRTPIDCLANIETSDNLVKKPWKDTNETFLTELLATSCATWVTCDSVTMLYEALATRARVGVLMLSSNKAAPLPNKLLGGIRQLADSHRVHLSSYGYILDQADLRPLADTEVQRCARIVMRQLHYTSQDWA